MTGRARFTDALGQRLIVCDGAMGTMLHAAGCALDRALPEVSLSDPKLVAAIHESYVSAGADVIQTNTFGANRLWLAGHGYPDQVEEINRAAVGIAREAAGAGPNAATALRHPGAEDLPPTVLRGAPPARPKRSAREGGNDGRVRRRPRSMPGGPPGRAGGAAHRRRDR
jgi:hypothetical protein